MRLEMDRIRSAMGRIPREFIHSPQYECEPLSRELGCHVILKVETLNPLRCFKGRGSALAVEEAISQGHTTVIAASAGNLGQAIAYCARGHGIQATVVVSSKANATKVQRISELGARVEVVDGDIEDARAFARDRAREGDGYLIEDSLDLGTCEGAATIGLELLEGQQTYDAVIIALGGGAMATGVGYVFKQLSPATQVVCVQPSGAPAATLSWRSKSLVETDRTETLADGVAGRFVIPVILQDLLEVADEALLVEESSIVEGMKLLYQRAGLVVEPSAALGFAALLENPETFAGKKVATILCGSNVILEDFNRWMTDEAFGRK